MWFTIMNQSQKVEQILDSKPVSDYEWKNG